MLHYTHKRGFEFIPHFGQAIAAFPASLWRIALNLLNNPVFFSDQSNQSQLPDQTVSNPAPEAARAGAEPESRNILLVDDAEDNRLLIQVYLRRTQFQVQIAENGEVAVELFKKGHFDLVLMDMQMPVMDGYTATKIIREWEAAQGLQATPILALTAYALKEDIQKALEAGCTAYLTKPVKKAILLETLSRYTNGET